MIDTDSIKQQREEVRKLIDILKDQNPLLYSMFNQALEKQGRGEITPEYTKQMILNLPGMIDKGAKDHIERMQKDLESIGSTLKNMNL